MTNELTDQLSINKSVNINLSDLKWHSENQ